MAIIKPVIDRVVGMDPVMVPIERIDVGRTIPIPINGGASAVSDQHQSRRGIHQRLLRPDYSSYAVTVKDRTPGILALVSSVGEVRESPDVWILQIRFI